MSNGFQEFHSGIDTNIGLIVKPIRRDSLKLKLINKSDLDSD